jgi:hypothetical protein
MWAIWRSLSLGALGVVCMSVAAPARAQPAPDAPPPAPSAPGFTPPSSEPFTAPPPAPPLQPPPSASPAQAAAPPGYPVSPQAPAPGVYPAPQIAPPEPPEPPRNPRVGEAHADRVMLLATPYTHPEGTFYVSSYDIALLQLGYAFTDNAQFSVTGTPPLGEDGIFLIDTSLKVAVVPDGPVRAAAIGSVSGLIGLEEGNFLLGRAGGVTQLCFDDACESSANVGVNALLAGPAMVMMTGAGVIWRVARWGSVLFEVDMLVPIGSEAGEIHGIAVVPGFRFPFRTWALDLGVARPLDVDEPAEVIPLVVFTYRFLP